MQVITESKNSKIKHFIVRRTQNEEKIGRTQNNTHSLSVLILASACLPAHKSFFLILFSLSCTLHLTTRIAPMPFLQIQGQLSQLSPSSSVVTVLE